jgi:hypothetical protein
VPHPSERPHAATASAGRMPAVASLAWWTPEAARPKRVHRAAPASWLGSSPPRTHRWRGCRRAGRHGHAAVMRWAGKPEEASPNDLASPQRRPAQPSWLGLTKAGCAAGLPLVCGPVSAHRPVKFFLQFSFFIKSRNSIKIPKFI